MDNGNGNGRKIDMTLYGFEKLGVDKRRKPEGERKAHDIQALWQRSHEILALVAKGYDYKDVAQILDISPVTVSNTVNSTLGKVKLSELRKTSDEETMRVLEKIRVLTDKALSVYNEILSDDTSKASLDMKKKTADTVMLELSGLRVPTRIQSYTAHHILTEEEKEEFKRRGIKAARECGHVIEVGGEDEKKSIGNNL